ncbi:hypothetical protein JCM11491_000415 [Sporobolomyces phaffii]
MLLDETEDGYTRHRGARELLEIIQQLTRPSFVHRPFDAAMTQHLERKFFWVIDDLEELGYERGGDTIRLLEQARQVALRNSDAVSLLYPALAEIVKLVMDSVVSLSVSASPFPLKNRHLPREIMKLIFFGVLEEDDLAIRQRTLSALSATARDWRQIVTAHRCVFLGNERALESWMRYRKIRELDEDTAYQTGGDLAELTIDLSRAKPKLAQVDLLRRAFNTTGDVPETSIRSVSVMLPTSKTQRPKKYQAVYDDLAEFVVQRRPKHSITAPTVTHEEFDAAVNLIAGGAEWTQRLELTVGRASEPIESSTEVIEELLTSTYGTGADKRASLPVFTNYASLVLPWHVFTIDQFLLRSIPNPVSPLPPSRLERLELTLEVTNWDLDKVGRDVAAFFAVLAPNLQHLALRIQLPGLNGSEEDEDELTSYFVRGLESCHKLRHLEIGGSGLARDLPLWLANLRLKELVLLPAQHRNYPRNVVSIFSRLSLLSASLKSFKFFDLEDHGPEDRSAMDELFRIADEREMTICLEDRYAEAMLLQKVTELVGIDLDTLLVPPPNFTSLVEIGKLSREYWISYRAVLTTRTLHFFLPVEPSTAQDPPRPVLILDFDQCESIVNSPELKDRHRVFKFLVELKSGRQLTLATESAVAWMAWTSAIRLRRRCFDCSGIKNGVSSSVLPLASVRLIVGSPMPKDLEQSRQVAEDHSKALASLIEDLRSSRPSLQGDPSLQHAITTLKEARQVGDEVVAGLGTLRRPDKTPDDNRERSPRV